MAKRGQQENQIVAIDNIQLKTILITKTDEEMPTTTTTTTTTTETTESTISDLPTGSSSGPTTLAPPTSTVTPVALTGGMIGYSGEVMIIFLIVALSTALALLSVKHHQIREKLREYQVAKSTQQNYDNPMFTGQHTSAERYGAIAGP